MFLHPPTHRPERIAPSRLFRDVYFLNTSRSRRLDCVNYRWYCTFECAATLKPFNELIDTASIFKILEKSSNGNTCATKNQAPLTRSGSRLTAGQADQSNMPLS